MRDNDTKISNLKIKFNNIAQTLLLKFFPLIEKRL